jgi:hypothetical protein
MEAVPSIMLRNGTDEVHQKMFGGSARPACVVGFDKNFTK